MKHWYSLIKLVKHKDKTIKKDTNQYLSQMRLQRTKGYRESRNNGVDSCFMRGMRKGKNKGHIRMYKIKNNNEKTRTLQK